MLTGSGGTSARRMKDSRKEKRRKTSVSACLFLVSLHKLKLGGYQRSGIGILPVSTGRLRGGSEQARKR